MKSLKQIREASGGKEAYQKFFNILLKKFGVKSPSELEGDKKKQFYDAIDKGWDGDNEKAESVQEAKKLSARAQFKAYVDEYDIKAYGMKNPDEAKKVIQFIFNAYKGSLTPEMMNDLVKDGSFFKNGIKANLKFGYNDWESTHFSGGLWIQKADYASIIKKNTGLKESFQEAVSVDRRTLGFKEAMKRAKEAKAKREAAKIKAAKTQSKTDMANIDANYAYDGDIEEILTSANKKIMGQHEDAAANASSSGAVDMNPTGKPKKKEKENLMAKYGY